MREGEISAPLAQGLIIGVAQVWYKEICVGSTDLVAMHPVRQDDGHIETLVPSAVPAEEQTLRNWLIIGALVLVGLVFVCGIVIVVIVLLRKRQLTRRHKLINEGTDR